MEKRMSRRSTITAKLLAPVFLIIVLSAASLGISAYIQEEKIITDDIKTQAFQGITEMTKAMETSNRTVDSVKKELSNNYISKARLIAELIAKDNSILSIDKLGALASEIGVDEIHVTDEKGILTWSNIQSVIGYDMGSSPQSQEFMSLISDKTKAIAQDPQPRGSDGELFEYVGVGRIDIPGIVQVGVKPEVVQQLLDTLSVEQDIKGRKLSQDGYFYILDKDGIITAHFDEKQVGMDVKKYDWGQRILSEKNGDFIYTYEGVEKHVYFQQHGDMFICAAVPTSDYLAPLNMLGISIISVGVIAVLLSMIIIYFLSRKIIIKPIKNIMELMSKAEKGDFTVKSGRVKSDEIGQLSKSFDNMVYDINGLIKSALNLSKDVSDSADSLAATSQEAAASTEEIADTIQQIAAGSTEGARSAQEGKEAVNKLAAEIENVAKNSELMKSASGEAEVSNQKGIESVNTVSKKFKENTQIAAEVAVSVSALSSKSKNIEEITDMITSIANQTNLLALNAAIEAARAGESGRGFAVVAEEIKKLAEQSAKGAEDISVIVADIRNETEQAVEKMDRAGRIVSEVNDSINSTNGVFEEVKESNRKLLELTGMVDEDIRNMKKDKDQIVDLINAISSVAEESAAASEQVAATTEEQSAAVEEVTASSQDLNTTAKKLMEAVSKFKV